MDTETPKGEQQATEDPVPLPKVTTTYRNNFAPSVEVDRVVERMLASVPPKYLVGLDEVVLTNTAGMPRRLRRSATQSRKRKVRLVEARGLYHPTWNNRPAWIELYVDNILGPWERGFWLKSRMYREQLIGDVLFHEIGHHIHHTARPEYREKEDVADVWMVRLHQNYGAKHSPVLRRILRLVIFVTGPLFKQIEKKIFAYGIKNGWMSRAEFEERMKRRKKEK